MTGPFSQLRQALADVPEVLDDPAYLDKLRRLGGLKLKPGFLARAVAMTYRLLWLGVAILSSIAFIIYWGDIRQEIAAYGLGRAGGGLGGVPVLPYVGGTLMAFWIITYLMLLAGAVGWLRRMRQWRERLGYNQVAMHLALAPAGGWMLAGMAYGEWRKLMGRSMVPVVVLFTLMVTMGTSLLMQFPDLSGVFLGDLDETWFWISLAVYISLFYLDLALFGLSLLVFVGQRTLANWGLLLLLFFQGSILGQPLGWTRIPTGVWDEVTVTQFIVGTVIPKVFLTALAWWIVLRHLHRSGPALSRKVLEGRAAQAAS